MPSKQIILADAAILNLMPFTGRAQDAGRRERLEKHVYYLASDSLRGRKAGSGDAAKAAEYIRSEYETAGLKPFFGSWYMPFENSGTQYKNVVGVLEGSDPVLKDEYIVLGAHYDHLGVKNDEIYNGADDNASGSAAVMEVAHILCETQGALKRNVIFAAFDAEEEGLYGSGALADSLAEAGVDVRLMMSVDMVGWLKQGKSLKIEGVKTILNGKELIETRAAKTGITVNLKDFEKSLITATDTEGFALNEIPTFTLTTGVKSPYHKPEDDAELIDYEGLDKVTEFIGGLTADFASEDNFSASGKQSFKHKSKSDYGIDIGPVVRFSSNSLRYKQAGLTTKNLSGVEGGIGAELSLKAFSITADALLALSRNRLIDDSDIYGPAIKLGQAAVKVPVCLNVKTPRSNRVGLSLGFGAYWSKVLESRLSGECPYGFNTEPWGLTTRFSFWTYNLCIGVEVDRQMNGVFIGSDAPLVRRGTKSFVVRYSF